MEDTEVDVIRRRLVEAGAGPSLSAAVRSQYRVELAEYHLRRATELAAELEQIDLRSSGSEDPDEDQRVREILEPLLQRARAQGAAAAKALETLGRRSGRLKLNG